MGLRHAVLHVSQEKFWEHISTCSVKVNKHSRQLFSPEGFYNIWRSPRAVCQGQLISWALLEEAVRAEARGLFYPSSASADRSLIICVRIPLPNPPSALFWVLDTFKYNSVITSFLIQKSVGWVMAHIIHLEGSWLININHQENALNVILF